MSRTIILSVALVVASLFVGNALKAHAATGQDAAFAMEADGASGYWAAWAEAASH